MNKTDNDFDLQEYLTKGVEGVIADAVRATLRNPKESAFMLKFAAARGNSLPPAKSRSLCRSDLSWRIIPPEKQGRASKSS